ncbi:MAG TPA: hypothetical protein VIL99_05985 [Ignavibacteria bacterium]
MKTIILGTVKYGANYFNTNKEAPYPGFDYKIMQDWEELKENLPLSALGIYKGQLSNQCFNFIKIVGMKYDNTNSPYFDFKVISRSNIQSSLLINALPNNIKNLLFSSINKVTLLNILTNIGVIPPNEWLNIQNNNIEIIHFPESVTDSPVKTDYLDFIGDHYKKLLTSNLNNDEFEDITASLLVALGFDIKQKGHNVIAAKADGVASFGNKYALVYDCKNSTDFVLREEFKRAINQYVQDEKQMRDEENIYPVFISRGFSNFNNPGFHCFTIESLLYLFYKKLILGNKFSLRPFSIILSNTIILDKKSIDIEWC